MAERVAVTIASDYATLEAGGWEFSYGYEFGGDAWPQIWGFEGHYGSSLLRLSHAEMAQRPGCPEEFDVSRCLLFGIGLWLAAGGRDA